MNQELAIRKKEIQLAQMKQLIDPVMTIVTTPAFSYVGLVLLLEYLSTHPKNNFELFGMNAEGYISKDTAKVITGGLTAALAANALGGGAGIGAGIGNIIKALK